MAIRNNQNNRQPSGGKELPEYVDVPGVGKIKLPNQTGGDVVFTGDKRPLDLGDYILGDYSLGRPILELSAHLPVLEEI